MKVLFLSSAILVGIGLLSLPLQAAVLVNINTASLDELDGLPYVGASTAQDIVAGRPYASIQEIIRVSGFGGGPGTTHYDAIIGRITVGDTTQTQTDTQTVSTDTVASTESTSSGTPSANSTGTGAVSLRITGKTTTVAGADLKLAVEASDDALDVRNTDFIWNFGDGATAEGSNVEHVFLYPGKYVVEVSAMAHRQETQTRLTIDVSAPQISLVIEGDGTLGVYNTAAQEVDIGGWVLAGSDNTFVIPDGTIVLPGETLRFTPAVSGITNPLGARLLFQSGRIAALAQVGEPEVASIAQVPVVSGTAVNAPAAQNTPEKLESSSTLAGAVAKSGAGLPWWSYGAALAVLLGIAVVGAWFAKPAQAPVAATTDPADEFEIV